MGERLVIEVEDLGGSPDPFVRLRADEVARFLGKLGLGVRALRPRDDYDDLAERLRQRAARGDDCGKAAAGGKLTQ
jgi:hypothetical protein